MRTLRTARRIVSLSIVAGVLITGVGTAAPAGADTLRVHDPNESGTLADTHGLTVVHTKKANGTRGTVTVRVRAGSVLHEDFFDLWIDTPKAGRNFYARIRPETEYGAVHLVRGWASTGPVACRRWEARSLEGRNEVVVFKIPRTCLGSPQRVRVSERSSYAFAARVVRDWVPAKRTFTAWVRASAS